MSDHNDNAAAFGKAALPSRADHHGEAALLLVESLIHGLVARSNLSIREALEITGTAIDARLAVGDDRGDDPAVMPPPVRLLSAIAESLRIDDRQGDALGSLPTTP